LRPLTLGELVGVDAYEALRDDYRARVMALKADRRLPVGDRVTLVFENRETIRFQVQEMMRVERLRDPAGVQAELDVYNELVPGEGELSATLLIEITDSARIRPELDRLRGLDACVFLALGEGAGALRVRARFDERQMDEARISAVHYLRFALPPEARARLREPATPARVEIDHAHYRYAAALPSALRASLAGDLAGDPAPLLRPTAGGGVALLGAVAPGARARLDADPALEAALLAAVKAQARALLRRHGACRVLCDLHAERPAWHVFAPE
jgi:hypothetical protein